MTNARDCSIQIPECKKIGLSQTKDGIVLRLALQEEDCPEELWRTRPGSRFAVVMVQIGDDEEPTAHPDTVKANRAIASAAMLCRDPAFQSYMEQKGLSKPTDIHDPVNREESAAAALRTYCGITSRSELRGNHNALNDFLGLRDDFMRWAQVNQQR